MCTRSRAEATTVQRPAVADYPPGAQMSTRVIDDFEFVWMLRGDAHVMLAGDRLRLRPGHLLLVPPELRHGFAWDPTRPSRHGYVHFEPGSAHTPPTSGPSVRRMTPEDPLSGLCAYLLWLGRGGLEDWEPRAHETLGFMLRLFVAGPLPQIDAGATLPPVLSAAVGHLRRAWSEPPLRRVSIDELAAVTHVSRGYINRLFRHTLGLSAARGLEHARCSRAETLLTRTDLSVEAIAHQCGFADASHFSHRFTAVHRVPPRAYRAAGAASPSVLDDPAVRRLAHLLWD
jgi:AraC-like DNA-binding protein